MKQFRLLLFLLIINLHAIGQAKPKLNLLVKAKFGNNSIAANSTHFKLSNSDSIQIETLKFYLSGIALLLDETIVWKETNSFHLIDIIEKDENLLRLDVPTNVTYNKISIQLGIDSLINVSGALGGDLDPLKGMYWTWQSGYINLKLEGKSKLISNPDKEFQFHLGGYVWPNATLQQFDFSVPKKDTIFLTFDVEQFLSAIDLSLINQIMTPGKEAVELSKKAASSFRIEP